MVCVPVMIGFWVVTASQLVYGAGAPYIKILDLVLSCWDLFVFFILVHPFAYGKVCL